MAHPVIHFEFVAPSYKELAQWYADLFGWDFNEFPDMSYATVGWDQDAGRNGGGFMPYDNLVPEGTLTLYIYTDDVEGHSKRIEAAGGTLIGEKSEVPGIGVWQRFRDPAGNSMAVMTPETAAMV
jgi:predicted enzyme related to lactoylglutathione lyase